MELPFIRLLVQEHGVPEGKGYAYGYDDSDPWLGYCFIVITTCVGSYLQTRWLMPSQLDPKLSFVFFPRFESYCGSLVQNQYAPQEDKHVGTPTGALIDLPPE